MKRFILISLLLILNTYFLKSQTLDVKGENYSISLQYEMKLEEVIPTIENTPTYQPFQKYFKHGIRAYKIEIDHTFKGQNIKLSGSILVPIAKRDSSDLVLYCHGTKFDQNVPSNWTNGLRLEALSAFNGYITFLPDYLGYGSSKGVIPLYYVKKESTELLEVFIKKALEALKSNDIPFQNTIHLLGFSQGGYTSLAIAEKFPSGKMDGLEIGSAISIGGPTDLQQNLKAILAKEAPFSGSGYLSYVLSVYNHYYWNMDYSTFFLSPMDKHSERFIKGQIELQELNRLSPDDIESFINPNFRDSSDKLVFSKYFNINSIKAFKTHFPILIFHSKKDEDVPFSITENYYKELKKRNRGNSFIKLYRLSGSHNQSGVIGISKAIDYINTVDFM